VPAVAQRATVDEVIDDYEADCRLRGAKSIVKMVSHTKIRARGPRCHEGDGPDTRTNRSKATVNRGLTILNTALKLARRRGKLVMVPEIWKFQETNVRRVFCTETEFDALVGALPDYLRDAARFAFYRGWRKGEVVAPVGVGGPGCRSDSDTDHEEPAGSVAEARGRIDRAFQAPRRGPAARDAKWPRHHLGFRISSAGFSFG